MKLLLAVFLLIALSAHAEQRSVVVAVNHGNVQLQSLSDHLRDGWRVVVATPVIDSEDFAMVGKPRQGFTVAIVYIIERDAAWTPPPPSPPPNEDERESIRERARQSIQRRNQE